MELQEVARVGPTRALPLEVLVIDDSPSDLRLLCEHLRELGVPQEGIRCASTLRKARAVLATGQVGCILLDLSLPDASGLEGLAILATAVADTPIVVVTGLPAADSLVYAALAEGAEEYVSKSELGTDRFADAICRAVQRRRGTTRVRRTELAVLDLIDAPTVAIDGSGQIIETNRAWAEVTALGGASQTATGVGVNYLTVCDLAAGPDAESAAEAAAGIRSVLRGDHDRFSMDYPCRAHGVERWYSLRVTPLGELGGGGVVTHLDISPLKEAELVLQREELCRAVFNESSPIFALVDADGIVRHVSARTRALLGLQVDEPVGRRATDRIVPADTERAAAVLAAVAATPGARERVEVTVLDGAGRHRHLDLVIANLLDDPSVGAIAVTGSDMTGSRRALIARRLESRLLTRLPAAVIVTDERGVVVYWNDRAATIFGYSAQEAVGRPVSELTIGPIGVEDAERIMRTTTEDGHWEGYYDARRADGSVIPIYTTLERIDDDEIGFHGLVGASVDMSDRRKLEEDLAFQALHDPLTGLPNRRMFVDQLENAVARATRSRRLTAVLFLDVDDFKAINDTLGHAAGDEVLRAVGALISAVAREGDIVARLGGDEFVMCCEDVRDVVEAYAIADRVQRALRVPFRMGESSVVVSTSVGLAVSGNMPAESLLRNADAAMYVAKDAGKGRIELFDDAHHERSRSRRKIALELQDAIEAGALVTHFQPEVDLATGTLFGFEALVRWPHPVRGLVPPDEFIAVAEESGLISQLGPLVLADACSALAGWLAEVPGRPLTMSVNVSVHQLTDPALAATVASAIELAGISPERLCLEVTESALMDAPAVAQALRSLREIGVAIAIDDFGTGYSSLSRLRSFPVDFLKIDRSFIAGLGKDPGDEVIVTAVVNLARSLGLRCIAEGIEDAEQLRLLTNLGCELGQGFLWSSALTRREAASLVHADPSQPLTLAP